MAGGDQMMLEEELARRPLTWGLFRKLLPWIQPYAKTAGWNLVLTVAATACQLLGPKFVQNGIDRFLSDIASPEAAAHGIFMVSAAYLLVLLAGWGLSVMQVKTAVSVGQGILNDLRLSVFEHIQRLSLNYFDRTHQGRIISRADTDIDSLDQVMTWGASQFLSSVLTLGGVLFILAGYDVRMCAAVAVVLPPLAWATWLFQKKGSAAYRQVRRQSSRVTASLAETISGVRVIQALAREDHNLERFKEAHRELSERAFDTARIFHTYMPFLGLMYGLGVCIILGYGGTLALEGEISIGQLAAFVLYLGMFFGPIQTMGDLYNSVLSAGAGAERIVQLLETEPQVADRAGARPLGRVRGEVRFEGVFFRYDTTPDDRWILENINLSCAPGETVALVGETGSGKTSIVSLLARFYEPQKGRILVDGTDLRETTLASLHSQIAMVTQDNFLFTGSVLDNLKFGRPEATDAEVKEAARKLGADALIGRMPNGYDTKVGERGANLSAGERQMVCFTRAMVADPRILILDEATSAVDPRTEALLQHALKELFAHRTTFVIAHRLSTIRDAGRIVVLKQGRIAEQGTHDSLVSAGGLYARLHAEFVRRG
jgi:putative ABC transport system ATP-binding protein/ATP-binding cassette subfamily B protein